VWIVEALLAEALLAVGISSLGLTIACPVVVAQVQGLDTPDRAGCPGGYVEGLGCKSARPGWGSPNIQDSDQGWQRDWRDFVAGNPNWPFYAYDGAPATAAGAAPPQSQNGPPFHDLGGGGFPGGGNGQDMPRGLGPPR
jgi:hypothetical protein